MAEESDPRLILLRALRKAYPAKLDVQQLISSISLSEKVDKDKLQEALISLKEENLIEESPGKVGGSARVNLSHLGMEHLHETDPKNEQYEVISPREIESKLISTYDSMKAEMEILKQNLESSQKTLDLEMGGLKKSIADHDQFLRTYFVRIIESISTFIGIFGIVVVMMVNNLGDNLEKVNDPTILIFFVVGLPLLLIITIMPTLFLIKHKVLEPRHD